MRKLGSPVREAMIQPVVVGLSPAELAALNRMSTTLRVDSNALIRVGLALLLVLAGASPEAVREGIGKSLRRVNPECGQDA